MNVKHEITTAFKAALLWSSLDDNDEPLDSHYDLTDFSPAALTTIDTLVDRFIAECLHLVNEIPGYSYSDAGHDLWLTLAGHGCGFWEQDVHGDTLTQWAHQYRKLADVYVGDDFNIEFFSGDISQ